jgi:hypothetical protein
LKRAAICFPLPEAPDSFSAEVDSRFYGEHQGREVIVVTFPSRKHNWLFEIAKRELSPDEYDGLRQLITSRSARTEREILLTERVFAPRPKP